MPRRVWRYGDLATGRHQGVELILRYGTSPLGPRWEIVNGDWFGHLRTEDIEDLRPYDEEP